MTDAIEFGPEIKRGSPLWPEGQERPVWLADGTVVPLRDHNHCPDTWEGRLPSVASAISWRLVRALKMPASHPASIAQRWNDDNPGEKPFDRLWFGGEEPPADWDGEAYLCRDGKTYYLNGHSWKHGDGCYVAAADWDRIAYRSKPSEQTVEDDGYVRVKRMTEEQAAQYQCEVEGGPLGMLHALGIIRPETPVERFKRENPGLSGDELLEKALAR